jgi:hypothetical protein
VKFSYAEVLGNLHVLVLRIEVAHNILDNVSHLLNLPNSFVMSADRVVNTGGAKARAELSVLEPPFETLC